MLFKNHESNRFGFYGDEILKNMRNRCRKETRIPRNLLLHYKHFLIHKKVRLVNFQLLYIPDKIDFFYNFSFNTLWEN